MDNKEQSFSFSYSAKEQEEVRNIRKKYIPQEEDAMQRLRRLDAEVQNKATVRALSMGIIGTLILGLGMSMCMVFAGQWFLPGIFVGIAGIGVLLLAYPIHQKTLTKLRKKIAPEMIRLTDELLK